MNHTWTNFSHIFNNLKFLRLVIKIPERSIYPSMLVNHFRIEMKSYVWFFMKVKTNQGPNRIK